MSWACHSSDWGAAHENPAVFDALGIGRQLHRVQDRQLLILALRNGQLSVLYPIIALTYVWVTILSPLFFDDLINGFKVAGVALIVLGVSFIGLGSRS